MKKAILVLSLFFLLLIGLSTAASAAVVESGTCGDNLTWTLDDAGTLTIDGTGMMNGYSTKEDPDTFEDCTRAPWGGSTRRVNRVITVVIGNGVTGIGKYAFAHCKNMTSVTIGDHVESIGTGAFQSCYGLTQITIPDSVTSIGSGAFVSCIGITELTIPDSVTSIGSSAFAACGELTRITIPHSVVSVPYYAFGVCGKLENVVIENGVREIGEEAFSHCRALTSVSIPNSVAGIGKKAFYNCSGLPGVAIPGSVSGIGESAFAGCTSLTSLAIGNGVGTIGTGAFSGCSSLNTVSIPNSVTSLGTSAFYNCAGLTSAVIGSGVSRIEDRTFYRCTNLSAVTIPYGVSEIGVEAFCYCPWLDSLSLPNSLTKIETSAFMSTGLTSLTAPGSVESIGDAAFYGCAIMRVTLEYGVETIGNQTFMACAALVSVSLPNSLTSIGQRAFQECTQLTSVTLPNSLTSIGQSAFRECTQLASVTIPNGVTAIQSGTFSYCTNLASVTVPDSVISVGGSAFESTAWMDAQPDGVVYIGRIAHTYKGTMPANTSIVIADGTYGISANAFYGCTGLQSISIPAGVTTIGNYAFYNCTGLTSVSLSAGVTTIGYYAFHNCTGLTSVSLPAGVTAIGSYAFSGCTGLTEVSIQAGIARIEDHTFYDCEKLTSVTLPEGVVSIGQYAFRDCSLLASVTLPKSLQTVESYAFDYCYALADVYYAGTREEWNNVSKPNNSRLTSARLHCHEHSFAEEVLTPSTCTVNGEAKYTCACGYVEYAPLPLDPNNHVNTVTTRETYSTCYSHGYTAGSFCMDCQNYASGHEEKPLLAHTWNAGESTLTPTCASAGVKRYTCTVAECGATCEESLPINPNNHENASDIPATDSTCVSHGYTAGVYCSACDTWVSGHEEKPLTDHVWNGGEITLEPRCLTAGVKNYTCSQPGCGETYEETLPALGHDTVSYAAQAPTCTLVGWEAYDSCTRCEYTTYIEIPALGHNYAEYPAQAAACTAIGWAAYRTCSRCGDTNYAEIPALGHDYIDHPAQAVTCTGIGWAAYRTCSRCDYTSYAEIPALGHVYVDCPAKEPTCTEVGWYAYTACTRCGDSTYVERPALGHDIRSRAAQAPTCTEEGWNAYVYCPFCDFTTKAAIPALGHDLTGHVSQAPTCLEIGWNAYDTCSRCDYTTYEELPALGHDLVYYAAKEPTYTEAGWNAYEACARCDYSTYEEIPALPPEPVILTQPTDAVVSGGARAYFHVVAGGLNVTYRWQYSNDNGVRWSYSSGSGARTANLNVAGSTSNARLLYRCVISNACGSVATEPVHVVVADAAPVVYAQPANATVEGGARAYFSAGVSGVGMSYQWQYSTDYGETWKNSTGSGAKTADLNVAGSVSNAKLIYRCVVTNAYGSITTETARVIVADAAPVIMQQPVNTTVQGGERAYFSVKASGVGMTYRWQYSKDNGKTWIDSTGKGAKTANLNIAGTAANAKSKYRCLITNAYGSTATNSVRVTVVGGTPEIVTQPVNAIVSGGARAQFHVAASGENLTYQWQYSKDGGKTWKNSTAASASTADLDIAGSAANALLLYRCVVSNACGSAVTNSVHIEFAAGMPEIVSQPTDAVVNEGERALFHVAATGDDLAYQWQYSTDNGKTWKNSTSASAVTADLNIAGSANNAKLKYRCVISNTLGSVTTNTVRVILSEAAPQ